MDLLLSPQLLASALVLGALYALVALGLNLIYGTMRLLNIAHGELVMVGGYVAYWGFTLLGVGPPVSLLPAMALAALAGLLVYRLVFRRVLRSARLAARIEANSLLVFFGLSVVLQNLAALAFTASPRAYPYLDAILTLGPVRIGADRLVVLIVGLVACAAAILLFRATLFGLAVRAIIQQRDAAALSGIDIDRTNSIVFALGFAMAALAGCLISMIEQVSPFMGFPYTIAAFVVVILGGLGNLAGSLACGFLLGFLETYGVALTAANYRAILLYGVFIAILLLRPQGLFGGAVRRG